MDVKNVDSRLFLLTGTLEIVIFFLTLRMKTSLKMKNKILTKSEMQVMNILWEMQQDATISDILERYPEPRPVYTTVATFLRILHQKGFVSYKRNGMGKQYVYSPIISKATYRRQVMEEVKDTCFDGSAKSLIDFFVKEEQLSAQEVEELLAMINDLEQHE